MSMLEKSDPIVDTICNERDKGLGMAKFDSLGTSTREALDEEAELQGLYQGYRGVDADYVHAGRTALDRWMDWKFGLRIHWGPYSVIGSAVGESWLLCKLGYPKSMHSTLPMLRAQYERLAMQWNPAGFDAEQWCDMIRRAGMKYFTFTCKHHDGFSMYDTKTIVSKRLVHTGAESVKFIDFNRHYSIMETPFGRDVTKELVDAVHRYDLGIGLYYSHIDWFDPDFRIDENNYQFDRNYTRQNDSLGFGRMIARHREQIRELCTNYGKIDCLCLDMSFAEESSINKDIIETIKIARRLQPEMLMRNRGIGVYGDYKTPEGVVPVSPESFDAEDIAPVAVAEKLQQIPWQVIYPGGKCMSYVWGDIYKPVKWIVETLVDIVAKGGNFQVGYGPGPYGTFDPEVVNRLEKTGDWLKINGEAIYGTRPYKEFAEGGNIRFTRSKDSRYVYMFLMGWPSPPLVLGSFNIESVRVKSGSPIKMLGLDHNFEYVQNNKRLEIKIPEWLSDAAKRPCKYVYVFRIEV